MTTPLPSVASVTAVRDYIRETLETSMAEFARMRGPVGPMISVLPCGCVMTFYPDENRVDVLFIKPVDYIEFNITVSPQPELPA